MKIIVEDGSDAAIPDGSLVRVLVRAHVIRDRLLADKSPCLKKSPLTRNSVTASETAVPPNFRGETPAYLQRVEAD
jgi:hypothetical protein